jgi:hypothetical protein
VTVPGPWQAIASDLRTYTGTARYRRRIELPPEWEGKRIRLCFNAVDYRASVEVNGTPVGEHEGGYLPFDFEIQDAAPAGAEAIIAVTVADDMAPDIPKGKQSWYGPLAGIWQSVSLEAAADTYIAGMRIYSDPASGSVSVRPVLGGADTDHSYLLVVWGPDGSQVESGELSVAVDNLQLWDLENPALYEAELSLLRDDQVIDTHVESFGFRTVEARDGKVWLNDRPVFLAGALDQDYYPHTMCTPPSDAFVREQIELAKELGLNCLRCHIKVPHPRYLDWADRLGMLIWAELPSWETFTPEAARRGRETLAGMIERDHNHPCIVAWTIMNESWGIDLGDADQRAWLYETVDLTHEWDPTRVVVDNSPCRSNFHIRSDLNDFHFYSAIPDQPTRWDRFVEGWTNDPASTYSPHGDAVRRGDEPMIVSEFGNWGLPDPARLLEDDGREPWWFDTGQEWSGGVVHPHGIEARAQELRAPETFGSMQQLFTASQQQQFESIQYEVEQMRLRPEIAGFVVTEFTDVYWECNGLLDLHRRAKAGHAGYRWIFGPDLPIGVPERRRCFVGERIGIRVHVAHASERDLTSGVLRWRSADGSTKGEQHMSVSPWTAPAVAEIELQPATKGRHRLELEVLDGAGAIVGRNWIELAAYGRLPTEVSAWSDDAAILTFLKAAGIPTHRWNGVGVSTGFPGPEGKAVLLASAGDEGAGVQAVDRTGTAWEGDWAQGMHWLDGKLRSGTPLLPRLDLTCRGLVPEAVLTGPRPDQALAGMYVGWIHKGAATAAVLKSGVVATTFPVLDAGPDDPMAVSLLTNLLKEAAR